jgi:hypothetical protein
MKRPFLVVSLAAVVAAAITWVVISERGGEAQQPRIDKIQNTPETQQPLIDRIQDTLDEDAAKGRFTGELGDFVVYETVPPDVEFVTCRATIPVTDPTVLKDHELWSDALGPTGIGWACPDGEIAGVNNEGLESRPGLMLLVKVYFNTLPVPVIRDAPRDRLELIEVEGHPAILTRGLDVSPLPHATASLAVIERFPEGDVPGIAVFVDYAPSVDEAIELAEKLIP